MILHSTFQAARIKSVLATTGEATFSAGRFTDDHDRFDS
jgi:hypothetical protein